MLSRTLCIIAILSLSANLSAEQNQDYLDYIEQNKTLAVSEMERTGIPASIKMAQALLESNAGRSELARKANNHFGIKCGGDWEGKTYKKKDDERNILGMRVKSCFRQFRSIQESFIAHSELLRAPNRQSRYSFLFDLDPKDYKAWARGLKKAGYATSKTYHRKLINLIEQYELYQLDYMTSSGMVASNYDKRKHQPENQERPKPVEVERIEELETKPRERVPSVIIDYQNDVKYIVSARQESAAGIAALAGITVDEILRYNETLRDQKQIVPAGTRVYMQPKRNSFRGRKSWHKVAAGESMLDISNTYAIDLGRLYSRNKIEKGQEPVAGAKIKIRGRKVRRTPSLRKGTVTKDRAYPTTIRQEENSPETLDIEVEYNGGKPKKAPQKAGKSDDPFNGTTAARPNPVSSQPADPFGSSSSKPLARQESTVHTVKRGETLWKISQLYGTSVDRIKKLNQLNSNFIRSGMVLKVK